jgi:hypothetical protein
MAIQFVGGRTQTSNTTSPSTFAVSLMLLTGGIATFPSPGDLVLIAYSEGSGTDLDLSGKIATSGFSLVSEIYANDTYDVNMAVFSKVMGAVPDYSVNAVGRAGTATSVVINVLVFRGVDQTTPFDVTTTTATAIDTANANPAAITPVTAGNVISIFGVNASSTTVRSFTTTSTSYLSGFKQASSAGATQGSTLGSGYVTGQPANVSYDPAQWDVGTSPISSSSGAVTIALRPAVISTGTASGTIDLTGSATGTVETVILGITGTAAGTLDLTGAASGATLINGTVAGTLDLTGTASGAALVNGTAAGSISLTGTASGAALVNGTAAGSISLTGTASGVVTSTVSSITGTAAGTLNLTGAASGATLINGTATGSISLTGTASGAALVNGTAAGSISLTGTASGAALVNGTAAGSISLTGTAHGLRTSPSRSVLLGAAQGSYAEITASGPTGADVTSGAETGATLLAGAITDVVLTSGGATAVRI